MNIRSTTVKRVSGNLLVLLFSTALSALVVEFLAQSVLDPIDYFHPALVGDEFLNHRIEEHTGGHDKWGFRNVRNLETADIVCIGDSMTYGVAALARESWPVVLGKLRAETVYNMGLGGYGSIQYLHLMRTLAVKLRPKTVVVGFFLGNDLKDAYNMVRNNKNWSTYGNLGAPEVEGQLAFVRPRRNGKFLGELRDWLSKNSVLYGLMTQLSAFDFIRRRELSASPDSYIDFRDGKHNVFLTLNRTLFPDMRNPRIQAGLVITKSTMLEMRDFGKRETIRLIIALIPTKERVYGKLLKQAGYIDKHLQLAEEFEQEDAARDALSKFLHEHNIEVVDLLPALEAKVSERDLYPLMDLHPNKEGYRVIAETINHYLNSSR